MVEELKDASDIKKIIGKNKGEEDPLLVAQRFLNIFRQLHIFDQKRRDEFNSMILSQPPEIRGVFGLLPGGSVLQEYVDELEISKGIVQSSSTTTTPPTLLAETKESPLAKIKNAQQQSSAPAQVNISGDAKLVADASFAQVLSQSVSSALMAANISKNDNVDKLVEAIKENSGNGKIVPDEKFAATMARAFSQALQYSDAGKKADIKELIEAVRESRKIELPEGFSWGESNHNPTPLIADETTFAQAIAMAVAKVVNDSQNKSDLSAEIKDLANAVRESRKIEFPEGFSLGNNTPVSTSGPLISDEKAFAQTIADAMAKVVNVGTTVATTSPDVRSLIEAIRENNDSNAEAISKAMVAGLSPLLSSLEKNQQNNPSATGKINFDAEGNFSEVIAKAFSQTFEISEKRHQEQTERLIAGFQDILSKERNSFEHKNNKGKNNNQAQNSANGNEQLEKITQDLALTLKSINESRKSENREISQAIKDTSKELVRMFAKYNANKNKHSQYDKEMINEIITNVAQAQSSIFQEMAKQQTNELSNIISLALKSNQRSSENVAKKHQPIRSIFNFATDKTFNKITTSDNIAPLETSENIEDKKDTHTTIKEKKSSVAKYIKSAFERSSSVEEISVSSSDWGFTSENEKVADEPMIEEENLPLTKDDTVAENQDIEFKQEEEVSEPQGIEGEDWEWEYEENESIAPQGLEGQDWEWEYEEPSEIDGEEGEDWEWEYEENESVDPQGLEGQDWEWEYEEDTDDNNSSSLILENISASDPMDDTSMIDTESTIPIDNGEIVIAELRNKQNFADPYLADNIGV